MQFRQDLNRKINCIMIVLNLNFLIVYVTFQRQQNSLVNNKCYTKTTQINLKPKMHNNLSQAQILENPKCDKKKGYDGFAIEGPNDILTLQNHPLLRDQVLSNYERVLSYSKLILHQQISFRNVIIKETEYIHQVYTKTTTKLPHLVFFHGFGATSMSALRLFEHLSPFFSMHSLDTFGFGFSSIGDFTTQFNFQGTRDYYISAVEEWRKATKIDKFYLVGHSFGGYIASSYASHYPDRVIRLFLISPAGVSENIFKDNTEAGCRTKIWMSLAQKVYNCNIRPSKFIANSIIGRKIVISSMMRALKIPERELDDWKEYLYNANCRNQSSQGGFYKIFEWPLRPKISIEQMIRQKLIKSPINFYFGDQDWMPKHGAKDLVQDNIESVTLETVQNSGHEITFDNPKLLCQSIVKKYHEDKYNE